MNSPLPANQNTIIMDVTVIIGIILGIVWAIPSIVRLSQNSPKKQAEEYTPPPNPLPWLYRSVLIQTIKQLQHKHITGFSPWIAGCIDAIDQGKEVSKDIIILALQKTRIEIQYWRQGAGVDIIDKAIEEIQGLAG